MAIGSTLSPDDDLKLCYALIKLAGAKPKMSEVATFMGIKEGATNWRYSALMKKCKEKFGEIGPGGVAAGGGDDQDNDTPAAPVAPKTPKRKRGKAKDGESATKKVKAEENEEAAEDDVEASEQKTTKVDTPNGAGDTEVKEEADA